MLGGSCYHVYRFIAHSCRRKNHGYVSLVIFLLIFAYTIGCYLPEVVVVILIPCVQIRRRGASHRAFFGNAAQSIYAGKIVQHVDMLRVKAPVIHTKIINTAAARRIEGYSCDGYYTSYRPTSKYFLQIANNDYRWN